MNLKYKEARQYAQSRGRVFNTRLRKSGNLVDWMLGQYCKVFVSWETIGTAKLPIFETWLKSETEQETETLIQLIEQGKL